MNTVLADSISHVPYLRAIDEVVNRRFAALELEQTLIYMINTVNADALPYLAEQFDVMGYKGMMLAITDRQKREVIKRAIELKKYSGTPWAIINSLKAAGFDGGEIVEHVDSDWAKFNVTVYLGDKGFGLADYTNVINYINIYKNERSWLHLLTVKVELTDGLTITDLHNDAIGEAMEDTVIIGAAIRHDGQEIRDGSIKYTSDTDILEIEVIPV